MFSLNGKSIRRVGFLGFGRSNAGVLEYLSRHFSDIDVTVRCKNSEDCPKNFAHRIFFGSDMLKKIDEDVLFISPSARRDIPELTEAIENGVILSSDAEFFFSNSDADVYGVTGSDGKSTTTLLASRLLSKSYGKAIPSGNIGEAMTPHLDDDVGTAYVTELSSFLLMYMKPKTRRAAITNISKNHLNWHKSFSEYIDAKRNIFDSARERIINFDCPISRSFARDYDVFAAVSQNLDESALRNKISAQIYVTLKDGKINVCGEDMLDTSHIMLGGTHNVANFMTAIALSYGMCDKDDILSLAESFRGLRHRCELVGTVNGVKYYDSSIDSSPKRCAQTLNMFSERVTVILGGRSKGLDFSELIPALLAKAERIIITGECAEEIENALNKSPEALEIPRVVIDDFYDAAEYAKKTSKYGDSVVLSPAATSYDKFKNFEERGDAFAKIINNKE